MVVLAACSENPNALKHVPDAASLTITPTVSLDQSVLQILSLYPKGLETAATTRWGNIKSKYAAGLTDPSQLVVAKQMLVDLTTWLNNKTPDMATPPNNETRPAANSRAVLYMSMYVYNGPTTPPPPYNPTADAVTGLVTPGAPATIVTPTLHAGVQLEAGSVAENTIIVVRQNPTPYPANCSGPLATKLCQYPQFYFFDMFPHATLLKPAKFNVCHVNSGDARRPLADHDRFRLAHTAPANPADYTPGSTIRNQNGESIEILPLIAQTFSTCVQGDDYPTGIIGAVPTKMLSRFARGLQKFFTPKNAYAIDVGLGGLSRSMSPFNDVDPLGTPDLEVQSINVAPSSVSSGGTLTLSYSVQNIGTATQSSVPATIILTPPPPVVIEGPPQPPVDQQIGSITLPSLVPGASDTRSNISVMMPALLPSGTYRIKLVAGSDPASPDANLVNNVDTATISVVAATDIGTLPGDTGSVATAINDAGHVVGNSQPPSFDSERPFIWVNGQMTSLGSLGGNTGEANAINASDVVVGFSTLATGPQRAFRWANGEMTNLGTLAGSNSSVATGINSSGTITGYGTDVATGEFRAWVWQNGTMTALELLPGWTFSIAQGINDAGQIVGFGGSRAGEQAVVWENGRITVLPSLGGDAEAFAIDRNGVVTGGSFAAADGIEHATRWVNGTVTDIGIFPGDQESLGEAISAEGRIVGLSWARGFHAFLWQNGKMMQLPALGGNDFAEGLGVNESGQIVGQSATLHSGAHAVIWQAPPLSP